MVLLEPRVEVDGGASPANRFSPEYTKPVLPNMPRMPSKAVKERSSKNVKGFREAILK
jgi:hypothetical protein